MKTELVKFEDMSLESITIALQDAFDDCESLFQAMEKHQKRLETFGKLLTAAKAKVPHGEWENFVIDTFAGRLPLRTAQRWMAGPKAPKMALLKPDTKADRIPDRVEVVEPGQTVVQPDPPEEPDPDPTPDPPTIRKTAAGSQKVPEPDKPRTQPIVPEIVEDETPAVQWPTVAMAPQWPDITLEQVVSQIIQQMEHEAQRKAAAKTLRKLADKLDPPKGSQDGR